MNVRKEFTMPKDTTRTIQNNLVEFGKKLGFIAVMEERIHKRENYAPIYDVVWYLDLDYHFNLSGLEELFINDPELFERIKKLPFAGFEIEGASTSSKNQISNFANLYSGNFLFNFVIVNNCEANGENDTYRRGVKIKNYFSGNSGDRTVFFLDNAHLNESINALSCYDKQIIFFGENSTSRSTFGGEKASVQMYEQIRKYFDGTGLKICQNYSPYVPKIQFEMFREARCKCNQNSFSNFFLRQAFYKDPYDHEEKKSTSPTSSFYIPKLDVVLGFNAPLCFVEWLKTLAEALKNDCAHYPILYGLKNKKIIDESLFISLISIEIESSINKHLNGGIYNMSKNSYAGILVTKESSTTHTEFFKKELGIKNITSYCLEG